jgi:hypothetical protein
VGEDRLAALAVPDRPAGEVAADRHPDHQRHLERTGRSPPRGGGLAADLGHRRPDVVEELDLGARAQAAERLADTPSDDARLGERGVEAAVRAEAALQSSRQAEHAALAFDLVEELRRGVGDVLAEHPHPLVGLHHFGEGAVDRVDEQHRLAVGRWIGLGDGERGQ